jgi:hypothetical protein
MPSEPFMVFVLAYGSPVFSASGSASISARSRTVLPGPFFRIAISPCPPMFLRMSRSDESFCRCSAINWAVSFSCVESSGFAWRCRYRSSYGAKFGRCLSRIAVSDDVSMMMFVRMATQADRKQALDYVEKHPTCKLSHKPEILSSRWGCRIWSIPSSLGQNP